jgi:hypothetical protein
MLTAPSGIGRIGRALAATVLALAATAGLAVGPPTLAPVIPSLRALAPPVARAADDIDIGTGARYVIVPGKALVRVTVDIAAVNQHPNQTSSGVVTRYFYNSLNLGVQSEATHFRATQGGNAVTVTSVRRTGYRLVTVQLETNLYFGETAHVRLRFDLPTGPPRSSSDIRVGAAFASFLAWAFGDHGSVRVEVPAAFDANVSGDTMDVAYDADGTEVLTATTTNAVDWYAWIDARNDDGLTRQRLDLTDGEQIIIRAWPEDTRWRKRVATILGDGVPDLARMIGLPWPVDGPLNVLEIHTPLLEGYAGFYDTAHDEITISEDLDDLTIVHEASHAWFNAGLFTERWITEGLADEYASRVLAATGSAAPSPDRVKPTAKVAFPLTSWPPPAPIADSESDAREQYGYDASWTVVREIVTSAGEHGMQLVFRAANARTTAYVGAGEPETTRLPNDWRRFLDLTEELGGATGVADLMATWVVPADQQGTLSARETARDDYHVLVTADGTWAAPVVVRMALDGWSFDTAEARITDAESIIAQRDATDGLAASLGLTTPTGLEQAYEAADSEATLGAAATLAQTTEASLEAVRTATGDAAASRDWLVSLGLAGKDPDGLLASARASWGSGDFAKAADTAALVSGTLAVAGEAGRGRAIVIASGIALLLLLIALMAVAWRQRRRSLARRATATAAASGAGSGAAPGPGWTPSTSAWQWTPPTQADAASPTAPPAASPSSDEVETAEFPVSAAADPGATADGAPVSDRPSGAGQPQPPPPPGAPHPDGPPSPDASPPPPPPAWPHPG